MNSGSGIRYGVAWISSTGEQQAARLHLLFLLPVPPVPPVLLVLTPLRLVGACFLDRRFLLGVPEAKWKPSTSDGSRLHLPLLSHACLHRGTLSSRWSGKPEHPCDINANDDPRTQITTENFLNAPDMSRISTQIIHLTPQFAMRPVCLDRHRPHEFPSAPSSLQDPVLSVVIIQLHNSLTHNNHIILASACPG